MRGQAAIAGTGPDFDTELAKFTPRQMDAVRLLDSGRIKFLLYGGALGGGKSFFLRWWSLRRLYTLARVFGVRQPVGMLACEDYPSLKDRQLSKISREFPAWFGKLHQDHKEYGRCYIIHPNWGGGILCFRNLDDPSKYASAEFCFICIDELTKNPYEVFDHVRTRARWKGLEDIECQFVAGTNPGSIGHAWVKQFWMDKLFPPEWRSPIDYSSTFAYVPSKADDNPHLDPAYWAMLETLAPSLRKAFRDGDWNIFLGQAFPELAKEAHTCEPVTIPKGAHIYSTFDWGFGAPFSFGWWWVDGDGRVYRFHEWYGWNGQPNQGLRLSDEEVAVKAIQIERRILPEWAEPSLIQRLAGHDIFQKKPDYKGGGQGPSTAEVFADVGLKERWQFIWRVGDPSRTLKIRQFHERLRRHDPDGNPIRPMLQVYPGCDHFFRTIGGLIQDEHNIEDIDTTGEDHVYDESCLICMARPLALPEDRPKLSATDKRLDRLVRGDSERFDTIATIEQERELARLQSGRDSWEGEPDDEGSDGALHPTI